MDVSQSDRGCCRTRDPAEADFSFSSLVGANESFFFGFFFLEKPGSRDFACSSSRAHHPPFLHKSQLSTQPHYHYRYCFHLETSHTEYFICIRNSSSLSCTFDFLPLASTRFQFSIAIRVVANLTQLQIRTWPPEIKARRKKKKHLYVQRNMLIWSLVLCQEPLSPALTEHQKNTQVSSIMLLQFSS